MHNKNKEPPGWSVWGHFGDGLWRAGKHVAVDKPWTQENCIVPQATKELAIAAAWEQHTKCTPR